MKKIEKKLHVTYDEVQAAAIRQAATAKVKILTGGPGTGKTTTTHGIISVYQSFGLKIVLAAPTGRAAKRMMEATKWKQKPFTDFWSANRRKDIRKMKKMHFRI